MKFLTMRLFLICLISVGISTLLPAQQCADCRFYNYVFDSVSVTTVRFGEGLNGAGQNQVLYMDVYQPVGDTASIRPVVLFAFGGGFIQGSRTDGYVVKACERFARAGYVAASIDYRIGFDVLGLWPNPVHELMRVFFRAMQDMRGSVQYMRAHADVMGNTWRVDTTRITIGGASAGAITALMVAHCDKDTEFEEMGSLSALNSLGGFYSSTGDYPTYSWEAMQVMNVAGALVNAEWVEPGDPTIVSAHGDQDGTVPYQGGNFDLGFASIGLEGSYLVDQEAQAKGVCSYLYTMVGQDHPSGSMSDAELDQIFNRLMPRIGATVLGKSFCCGSEVAINPNGDVGMILGDTLTLAAQWSNPSGNEVLMWCGNPCSAILWDDTIAVAPDTLQQFIAISTDSACMSTDFVILMPAVGIQEGLEPLPLKVWPNPGRNMLRIGGLGEGKWNVEILDLAGRSVLTEKGIEGEVLLHTTSLSAGVYVLRVANGDRVWQGKWIKE